MSRGFVGLEGSEIDFCWVSRGLGGSGFGVKSVFAGCLDGLATFLDWFVNVFFIVFFVWFGVWFGGLFLLGVSWFWLVWHLVWCSFVAGCLVVLAGLAAGLGKSF